MAQGKWLEPYQFSRTLLTASLRLVDAVARETKIEGLLPDGVIADKWSTDATEQSRGHHGDDPMDNSTLPYLELLG